MTQPDSPFRTPHSELRTPHSQPLRFALVGCGRVAPTHFGAIREMEPAARLVAVCDHDPAALQKGVAATGADGHASLEDMLAREDIDVVSVCTPSGLHAAHGIAAAKAGKHVLVEKPTDVTMAAARRLVDACVAAGVHLFPVYQNRHNTTLRLLKAAIEKGRFGKLFAINGSVIWRRTQEYYDSAAWRGTRAMDGGALMNQGIHFLDAMRFVGGEIVEIHSMLETLSRQIECEDTGSVLLRFENGALGNLFVTMLGHKKEEGSLTVLGEKGHVKIGGGAMNTIEIWDFDEPDPGQDALAKDADYHTASVYGNGHKAMYRLVLETLTPSPAPPPADYDLGSLCALETIYTATDTPS